MWSQNEQNLGVFERWIPSDYMICNKQNNPHASNFYPLWTLSVEKAKVNIVHAIHDQFKLAVNLQHSLIA